MNAIKFAPLLFLTACKISDQNVGSSVNTTNEHANPFHMPIDGIKSLSVELPINIDAELKLIYQALNKEGKDCTHRGSILGEDAGAIKAKQKEETGAKSEFSRDTLAHVKTLLFQADPKLAGECDYTLRSAHLTFQIADEEVAFPFRIKSDYSNSIQEITCNSESYSMKCGLTDTQYLTSHGNGRVMIKVN